MKKCLAITLILTIIFFAIPIPSNAASMGIGVTTWTSWWDFEQDSQEDSPDIGHAFLFGPAVSIGISPKWKVSAVFLYGKFKPDVPAVDENSTDGGGFPPELKRYDLDVTLSYILLDYFKIFVGGKFMGYEFEGGTHMSGGPAIGMGLTLNLVDNLYLLFNVSGMFLFGGQESERSEGTFTADFYEAGVNSSLSLAYYFTPINTTLSIGFRHQFFKTIMKDDLENEGDQMHNFYGITIAAVFSFNI
ncbi:hypothetical protein ACFL20_10535 [Spirochaetota bacterium]